MLISVEKYARFRMNFMPQRERRRWSVLAPTAGATGGLTAALVSKLKWPQMPTHHIFASVENQIDTRYIDSL